MSSPNQPHRYIIEQTPAESSAKAQHRDDDAAEGRTAEDDGGGKRQKTKTGWKSRKMNNKPKPAGEAAVRICKAWATGQGCPRGADGCKFNHSWAGYFEVKPTDVHHEIGGALSETSPFVASIGNAVGGDDVLGKTIDLNTQCPVYKELGYCTYGWKCRFLGGHVRKAEGPGEDSISRIGDWELLGREEPGQVDPETKFDEVNWPKPDVISDLKSNRVGETVHVLS